MTKAKLYLALQAVVCIALAALLSVSAISICREGSARKAEQPMESVYTPQAVAGRFAPIAPLFFAGIGLLIAGLALGVRDEGADKPVKDAELMWDIVVSSVAQPSPDMLAARRAQRRLAWAGRVAFAVCMVPILLWLLDPDHFPEADPEGMFFGLLRVLLPWSAAGLGALAAASALREKSVLRETRAAQAQLKAERAAGVAAAPKRVKTREGTALPQAVVIALAVALIIAGAFNGSARDVLYKAITICTECVGLG